MKGADERFTVEDFKNLRDIPQGDGLEAFGEDEQNVLQEVRSCIGWEGFGVGMPAGR